MLTHSKQKLYKYPKFNLFNVVFAFCTLLLFSSCASDAPTVYDSYDPLIWKARLALKDGNNGKAVTRFEEAFEVLPHDNTNDLFYAAEAALKVGKNNLAKTFIKTAFIHHNPDSTYYVSFFAPFKGEEIFDEIQAERSQMRGEYYANLPYPKEIHDEMEQILKVNEKFNNNEDRHKSDSIKMRQLLEITRKYGWINDRARTHLLGVYGTKSDTWKALKSAIDNEIKKGKLRKSFWAFLDDAQQMQKNRKQVYGESNNWEDYPIMNIKNVDKRRAKIGLPPIWYVSKLRDSELPEGYTAASDDFLKSLQ